MRVGFPNSDDAATRAVAAAQPPIVRRTVRRATVVVAALAPLVITLIGPVSMSAADGRAAGAPRPFPDEWFFDGAQRPPALKALEGKPAPELAIESWIGDPVTLASLRGKVVIVDFWATWCGPCLAAIPHNVDLARRHGNDGLVLIGIHDANSGWDRTAQIVRDRGINYTVGKDRAGSVSAKAFAVQFWPTYIVIDRAGVVRGAGLATDRVEAAVKVLLAEAAPDLAEMIEPEFPAEMYYGGAARPASLRQLEGRPAPALSAQAWGPGGPVAPRDELTVLAFVAPQFSVAMRELDRIEAIHREYAAQGVLVVGVCDVAGSWEAMTTHIETKSISMRVMQDARRPVDVEAAEGGGPDADAPEAFVGATATDFGVSFVPTTIVIDRVGRIRAAGVRADRLKDVLDTLLAETVSDPATDADAR